MAGYDEVMNGLRAEAQRLIGRNAVALAPHGVGPQTKAPTPPEKQWWNLPAKYHAAERIAGEELERSKVAAAAAGLPNAHNNAFDAMRHARASARMASEIDPVTAYLVGGAHEVDNTIPSGFARAMPAFFGPLKEHAMENWHGQQEPERLMDLRNNAEGRRAAREGRAVDPARLQSQPGGATPIGAPYTGRR